MNIEFKQEAEAFGRGAPVTSIKLEYIALLTFLIYSPSMGLYRYNRFKPISAKPYWILSNGGLYVFQIWVVWFCLPETQTTNQVALQFWFIYNKSQDICHKHTVDVVFPIYSYFKQVGDVFACIPDVLYIQYASADMCNHCFIDEITTKWCLMSFMIFMVGLKYLEKWMCRPILPSIYIYIYIHPRW